MDSWRDFSDWMFSFGGSYGVNPVIFASLYFGTIPFSLLSFAWLAKNARQGKPVFLPLFSAFLCYVGTYIYLFACGKNIPAWVYFAMAGMMIYGGWVFYKKMR